MEDKNSNKLDAKGAEELLKYLDESINEKEHRKLLEALRITGIADNQQMMALTGMGKDHLRRAMSRVEKHTESYPRLFLELNEKLKRPGLVGRAPKIYILGPGGAALLRAMGYNNTGAYKRENTIAHTHALAILDVAIAARQAGLNVVVEGRINYENGYIIPDLQIFSPDGQKILIEIEQYAHPNYVRRMLDGVKKRVEFFKSPAAKTYSPIVRTLFNLLPGRDYEQTLKRWHETLKIIAREEGGTLPYTLMVMPLQYFLQTPDWGENPGSRWHELNPSQEHNTAESRAIVPGSKKPGQEEADNSIIPEGLLRRTSKQDALVLRALWQYFLESEGDQEEEYPMPSAYFFEVMGVIYAASLGEDQMISVPYASLYLLKRYLNMHPKLRQSLNDIIEMGEYNMRWNPTTILHRMQTILDTFLNYHGWRSDGVVRAFPDVPDWNYEGPKTFTVRVVVKNGELLMTTPDGVIPGKQEIEFMQHALQWVLEALFKYAESLDLRRALFW